MAPRTLTPEDLSQLPVAKTEVLKNPEEIAERSHALRTAMALTNSEHEDVGLVVQLENGETVAVVSNLVDWEDQLVELRGGVTIPLHAIVRVEL